MDDGGGGGGGSTQAADSWSGGGGGGGMNELLLRRGIITDGNLDVISDEGIVGGLYSDNLCEAPLGALCGVSSKMVNRNKGLGHRRRKGAT